MLIKILLSLAPKNDNYYVYNYFFISLIAACAAANLAIGTLYGLQETSSNPIL
jgi:hypothetical protein